MNKRISRPFAPVITGDGLPAHQVARRCASVESAADRELIWFLQELSMRSGRNAHHQCDKFQSWPWETPGFSGGGLRRVAADLVSLYPEHIGTPTMCKLKRTTGDYNAPEMKAIRAEIPVIRPADYRVRGEVAPEMWERDLSMEDAERRAQSYPHGYPVKIFIDLVENALQALPQYLQALSLDPTIEVDRAGVWYVTGLVSILRRYKQRFEAAVKDRIVSTEITRLVQKALELAIYKHEGLSGSMVVVEGAPREGKSSAAQWWALQRLGRVRYVQLESSADECSFFRLLSQAIGTPYNPELKAFQMRAYVQEALSAGDLLLLIDEADHLWPRTIRPIKAPARIEWINTALKNRDIPVAMVGTYKFSECITVFSQKCKVWASEQFAGRLAEHTKLPSELSDEDLRAIALHLVPGASEGMLMLLAAVAKTSEGYVATIERAVQKAMFLAQQQGHTTLTTGILTEVCNEIAGIHAAAEVEKASATPQHSVCNESAKPMQRASSTRATRTSVVQSHILEAPTNRLNSEPLVAG
jgi:hypothetical protein